MPKRWRKSRKCGRRVAIDSIKNLRKSASLFLLLGWLISCEKKEEAKATIPSEPSVSLRIPAQTVDSLAKIYQFNGTVALGRRDSLLFIKSYGFENFRTKKPLTEHSAFAIGSVSKQFTAVLILRLAEQGKLKTTDILGKFLNNQYPNFGHVTVHQLLTHTAGIHDGSPKLHSVPGEKYSYSNTGYYLLQQIIEKVSGKKYSQVLAELAQQQSIFGITTAENGKISNFSSAWIGAVGRVEEVAEMPQRLATGQIGLGAGGVVATLPALVRWNFLLYSGKLLQPKTMRQFLQIYQKTHHYLVDDIGYGYGLMYHLALPVSFFHSGYVKGSASLNVYYPKSGISLIICSNLADEAKGKDYIFRFHKTLFKKMDALQTR